MYVYTYACMYVCMYVYKDQGLLVPAVAGRAATASSACPH
jgi:hypothetical protein